MSKYKKFFIEHPKHEAIEDQAEISEASYLPFSSVSKDFSKVAVYVRHASSVSS